MNVQQDAEEGMVGLRDIGRPEPDVRGVRLILVPGVGTTPCPSWFIANNPSWQQCLRQLGTNVTIHAYDHSIPLDDQFEWQHLLDEGGKLLDTLHCFHEAQKAKHDEPQPFLFMCHGLGGSILKQAVCVAGVHYGKYSELLNSIAGIIFLGTPHRLEGVSTEQFAERLLNILRLECVSSLSRHLLHRLQEHAYLISDLANRFNRTNLRVDMLSVYETETTKIKASRTAARMMRSKKIIVVDKQLCRIGVEGEELLGASMSHHELVRMEEPKSPAAVRLQSWLAGWIEASHAYIGSKLSYGNSRQSDNGSFPTSPVSVTRDDVEQVLRYQMQTETVSSSNRKSPEPRPSGSSYVNLGSGAPDLQTLIDNGSFQQADPRIPCFMVDTYIRNRDFFGRHNIIQELDDCLLPSKTLLVSSQPDKLRVALLLGLGGIGKTETAIEYAYLRKGTFDAVFWINAADEASIDTDIAKIASRLGINDPLDPHNKAINKNIALEWLCEPWKTSHIEELSSRGPASWLLIFDNADDPEVLRSYGDIISSGAVLITSRNPLAQSSLVRYAVNVNIQPFSEDESALFIHYLANKKGDLDEAKEVGRRLGGLPLALAQMAGMIEIEFLSYREFLASYDDKKEEADLHDNVLQPLRSTARGNISTVWALDQLSDNARMMLELASFLSPDCIQELLLCKETCVPDDNPLYPRKGTKFRAARTQLIGSSILRHNQQKREFWMHRVTQDVVQARMTTEHRFKVFKHAVAIIHESWPAQAIGGHDVSLWDTSEAMCRHIMNLKTLYLKYFSDSPPESYTNFAALLTRAAWYQHERGESYRLQPLLQLALEICLFPGNRQDFDLESDIRYTLGAIANETNDVASCIQHAQRFLDIRLEVAKSTGEVDERLARGHNETGIAWMMAGEWAKGGDSFSTAAKLYEQLPNYTKDKRSLALVNFGLALWLQGKLEEAERVLLLGLRDREELYGVMDAHSFRTGRLLHALGNLRFSQGKVRESEEFHRKALHQYQSTIGNHHHRTADVCHRLAQHCLSKRLYDEAFKFIDWALKIWQVDTTKYKPEIARTTHLQAKVLFAVGREQEASHSFQRATSLRADLAHSAPIDGAELQEADFDALVTFWSR